MFCSYRLTFGELFSVRGELFSGLSILFGLIKVTFYSFVHFAVLTDYTPMTPIGEVTAYNRLMFANVNFAYTKKEGS